MYEDDLYETYLPYQKLQEALDLNKNALHFQINLLTKLSGKNYDLYPTTLYI